MPFAHSEPLARTETSVKTAPTTRTIETLVAMSPMPTSGETIPPIKKPDAPMAAAAVPAFVRSAFNAKAVAGGWLMPNMNVSPMKATCRIGSKACVMRAAVTAIAKTNIPVPAIFRALNSLPTLPDNAQPMAVKTAFNAKHRLKPTGERS